MLLVSSPQEHAFICHWQRRAPSPRHALRAFGVKFYHKQNKNTGLLDQCFYLAGAEGLEPSARGFGDGISNALKPLYIKGFEILLTDI
ncbi:MAG: hypothetical protein IJN85_03890 [Oscillospiraceae bacterium]|nr:hypothetical protein [Oscillospiraceae bacterium]